MKDGSAMAPPDSTLGAATRALRCPATTTHAGRAPALRVLPMSANFHG
jgi:hypothetical protein